MAKHFGIPVMLTVALIFIAYIPVMEAGFVWDDDSYITENPTLLTVKGLSQIWFQPTATPQYYPVVFSSFWLEHKLWGFNPLGYHLLNVLFHSLGALVLWWILRNLQVPGAWLAAVLFALHPVHVESVAWVTERKNVLSGLFYFCSALCLIRFFDLDGNRSIDVPTHTPSRSARGRLASGPFRAALRYLGFQKEKKPKYYVLGLLCFVMALLSKSVTSSLPAAMLLVLWWKRGRVKAPEVVAMVPFFVLGVSAGLSTAWLERVHVGAQGIDWQLSFLERCLIAGRALWFYAGKLVWPAELTFNYPRWEIDTSLWWQYVFPLGVLLVVFLLWQFRRRLGRGPLVGVLFFCGTLFPALGFFDVFPFLYSFVADHFQYLASVGLIVLAAAAFTQAASRFTAGRKSLVTAMGIIVIAALGIQTWRQCHVYNDLETLWKDTLKKNPSSWMAHNNLGIVLANQGKPIKAIAHYSESIRIKPDHANTHNNLGLALAKQGRVKEAVAHYSEALRINPNSAIAHNNLGLVLAKQGYFTEAIAHFSEALRINPDHASAHNNLGNLYAVQGKPEDAIQHYSEALRIKPNDEKAHNNLGNIYAVQGKSEEAIKHYSEALRINPDHANTHNNLGLVLAKQGRLQEAITHFSEALRINPDNAEAHNSLGIIMAQKGNFPKAIKHFREAVRIEPDFRNAQENLRRALEDASRK